MVTPATTRVTMAGGMDMEDTEDTEDMEVTEDTVTAVAGTWTTLITINRTELMVV